MRFTLAAALGAAALVGLLQAAPLRGHEGHDHSDQQAAPVAASGAARAESSSSAFELVVTGRGDTLAIYLDRFATNEPVEGAAIEVETPAGPAKAEAVAGAAYSLPAPWLKPGRMELIFTVTADGVTEILPVSFVVPEPARTEGSTRPDWVTRFADPSLPMIAAGLAGLAIGAAAVALGRRALSLFILCVIISLAAPAIAHEGEDHGDVGQPAVTTGDLAQRLPDGRIFVPKATQRIFGVRTLIAQTGLHKRMMELPGRVIPDPNASGYVQSAVGGRLSPPPGGFPLLGTPVKEGDILAYVTPPIQAVDVSDMRQKQGELDQETSIVERKLARFETLAPSGAVARSQLEDARSELKGLKERRAFLERTRKEPEALVAPVSGIVAEGSAIAGQIAQPNAMVFQIIDPSRLWVEALSFDAVPEAKDASARTAAGKSFNLAYRGAGFADRSQSIPVHFAIEGEAAGLRAGQFVTVLVSTQDNREGIAIPRSALVRAGNGQDVVFEHDAAEIFIARQVRTEPLDGERVLISAGIEPGKRIVTQGADLLDHVR